MGEGEDRGGPRGIPCVFSVFRCNALLSLVDGLAPRNERAALRNGADDGMQRRCNENATICNRGRCGEEGCACWSLSARDSVRTSAMTAKRARVTDGQGAQDGRGIPSLQRRLESREQRSTAARLPRWTQPRPSCHAERSRSISQGRSRTAGRLPRDFSTPLRSARSICVLSQAVCAHHFPLVPAGRLTDRFIRALARYPVQQCCDALCGVGDKQYYKRCLLHLSPYVIDTEIEGR